ncbi:MAG: FliH/SctL family protein [Bryobacteraceae bacterium]|nr:FliH/SctL family protein [Bryobacteraceae bacterium]
MSSRILRDPPGSAAPFVWPQFGQPAPRAERQARASEPQPAEAAQLLQQALAEQEAKWRAESEAARRDAYQQGLEEGRRQAAAQWDAALQRLARSLEEIAGYKPRLRLEAEREVVELALAIARRILRRELHIDPEAVLGLVKAAMEKAAQREITEIRVHPGHAELVRAHLARIGAPEALEVRADAALEPGAVVLETARGLVDASIETQLDEIGRALADALHRRPS